MVFNPVLLKMRLFFQQYMHVLFVVYAILYGSFIFLSLPCLLLLFLVCFFEGKVGCELMIIICLAFLVSC